MEDKKFTRSMEDLYHLKPGKITAFNYDLERLDTPSYTDQVLRPLVDKLPTHPKVLDLGSGVGKAADILETMGAKVFRLDLSQAGLRSQSGKRVKASATKIPFEAGSMDGVHCKDMYDHVPRKLRDNYWDEVSRVLRSEGYALVVYNPALTHSLEPRLTVIGRRRFTKDAAKHGLQTIKVWSWIPGNDKDWYLINQKRNVVLLKKTPSK